MASLAAGLALALAAPNLGWRAEAQQAQRPAIGITPTTPVEAASTTRFIIRVGPAEAIPKNSFVRVRGLPPAAALTDGHAIGPGAWAVPLAALPTLSIVLPVGVQGSSEISISLVAVDGAVLAEAKTTLVVAAVPAAPRAGALPQLPPVTGSTMPAPPPPILSPAERERALSLHTHGIEQIERGNIYAARKFFERAVEAGLAQSAVSLAATYDPDELAKLQVVGLQPDVEAARKWYERARELGAAEAGERLRRLGSR